MPAYTHPASLRRLSRAGSIRTVAPAPPAATSPANADSTDAQPAAAPASPASPRPTSPLISAEDSIVSKAVRAYERDRQRAKKTKERAERELEKQQHRDQRAAAPDGRACRQCRDGSGRRAEVGVERESAALALGSPGVEEIIADVVERERAVRGTVDRPLEVHLAQLVKPSNRARRSKAGEFEIIPGIPVVIALDEHIAEEAELDEPWEHISADELDEKRVAPPSYATVVASTA
ncbi:hypothetical protein C8Q79DRAFT_923023 [Trametes meyenii]|nr:hypothetical protein C8Q79DRAFT_923023 [Trametes meyenii]